MNVQAHIPAGQVPNQGGLPQQNGNTLPPNQMQNLVGGGGSVGVAGVSQQHNMLNVDSELLRARGFMRDRIFSILLQRQTQPIDEATRARFRDISKRLEEGLFKAALTKEDYMNLETLEFRLSSLIKGRSGNNHNQRHQQLVNSSSSIGTMIPTPGMSHNVNSSMMVTSSVDSSVIVASGSNTIAPTTVNTGSLLSAGGLHSGSFNRSDGTLSNGYQQSPANFSIGSGGNMSSMGAQRITSQMIPTPGFNSNNNNNSSSSSSNPSYMNLESSNNGVGFSTVESTMVSQPQQQKQHVGGQNSRILHNLGSHMGSGISSGLQHKSYGFSNGALNGGLGMIGNNLPLVNEPGTSEGYLTTTPYANSPKPLQQHFDHQRPLMQGDGYGMSNADNFGTGNFYGVTSVGAITNNHNFNSVSLQSPMSKTSSPLIGNQSNLHGAPQGAHIKPPSIDQSEKLSFSSPLSSRDNLLQSHQQQQFQQQPHQFQHQQQFVQPQRHQKQHGQQQQHLLNNGIW
ncbi:histone acetyltransferase HAC1-like [Pistacia vera]|uniref:histone acetyltransferase HAC1-like n=1 Tax=Pistacia vera TaxID=55513 RepID=UPI001262FD34|nr:histone acetyltransferase HAC1-like [Pistacia vera]